MTDTRFTTEFADLGDLVVGLEVDGAEELATLLMFLLDRPVGLDHLVENDATCLEVIVHGNALAVGAAIDFPASLLEIARCAANAADELGPYARDGSIASAPPDVFAMDEAELMGALQHALGKVRVAALIAGD